MAFTENGVEITQYFAKRTDYAAYLPLGGAWTVGNNSYGQLGILDITHRSSPIAIAGTNWIDVSVLRNGQGAFLISEQNDAWLTGALVLPNPSTPTQVGSSASWTAIADGLNFTLALQSNGTLWAWGGNSFGQLGLSDQTNRSSPTQVGTLSSWSQIKAGGAFGVGATSGGQLWAWGNNSFGQLGTSNQTNYSSPVQINSGALWWNIALSQQYGVAVQSNGTLWSWGANLYGQLGLNTSTTYSSPVQVGSLSTWSVVSTGLTNISAAIKTDGTLWTWGVEC